MPQAITIRPVNPRGCIIEQRTWDERAICLIEWYGDLASLLDRSLDIFSGCRKAEFIDTAEVSKVFHYLKSIIDDVPSVRLIVTDNNKLIVEAKDTEGLIVPLIISRPIDTGTKPYPFNE